MTWYETGEILGESMPQSERPVTQAQLSTIALSGASITVDTTLSSGSTNPIQNRAVYQALTTMSGSPITVDTTLSSTSTNPIQNKAVYQALTTMSGSPITVDSTVTSGSTNPVQSKAVYQSISTLLGVEVAATYAAISATRRDIRLVLVQADETDGGATNNVYLFSGVTKIGQIVLGSGSGNVIAY